MPRPRIQRQTPEEREVGRALACPICSIRLEKLELDEDGNPVCDVASRYFVGETGMVGLLACPYSNNALVQRQTHEDLYSLTKEARRLAIECASAHAISP